MATDTFALIFPNTEISQVPWVCSSCDLPFAGGSTVDQYELKTGQNWLRFEMSENILLEYFWISLSICCFFCSPGLCYRNPPLYDTTQKASVNVPWDLHKASDILSVLELSDCKLMSKMYNYQVLLWENVSYHGCLCLTKINYSNITI